MSLLYITTSPLQLTLWLLWFSFVFNDARLQESSFKSRKSTTSMNSINAFADIRVRYPKINEIFKVCQLLCCAQNIVHHYYSYSQKLSNWALLSITTIICWKEKSTCTYIPFELLGILFSLQIKHIMQSKTTMSYHSIFLFLG